MAIKTEAAPWAIPEQIIEDPASGLTFQFEVVPDTSAPLRLRIFGNLPFGNREILFNSAGKKVGTGTATTGLCRPAWLQDTDQSGS